MQILAENLSQGPSYVNSDLPVIHIIRDLRNLQLTETDTSTAPAPYPQPALATLASQPSILSSLTSRPANRPIPSTTQPSFAPSLLTSRPSNRPIPSESVADGPYPSHILETALYTSESSLDKTHFYPLWRQVLAYWFPASEGFMVMDEWQPPAPNDSSVSDESRMNRISMVVLHKGNPVALLLLQGCLDTSNDYSRQHLRGVASDTFDQVALWSSLPFLCVIAAMGTKWNAFLRPTDMTSEQAKQVLGYDWFGEWEEDIVSDVSYEALGHNFRSIKVALSQELEG